VLDNLKMRQWIRQNDSNPAIQTVPGWDSANDRNKVGAQPPTQKNQGKRTPLSRDDRQAHLGADNQSRERRRQQGGPGAGPMPGAV
jgi:hypothetical protein